jgi:hypothetical protein
MNKTIKVEGRTMQPPEKRTHGQERRDPTEQRCCPRFPFSPAVEAFDIEANTRVAGRLSDIARHGCYMDTISPFAVTAAVTLMITKDSQSFTTQAKVVYSQIGMGMGLFFTAAEPGQLRMLETWLAELSEGKQRGVNAPPAEVQPDPPKSFDRQTRDTLADLVSVLSRKDILSDSEAQVLMRRLAK